MLCFKYLEQEQHPDLQLSQFFFKSWSTRGSLSGQTALPRTDHFSIVSLAAPVQLILILPTIFILLSLQFLPLSLSLSNSSPSSRKSSLPPSPNPTPSPLPPPLPLIFFLSSAPSSFPRRFARFPLFSPLSILSIDLDL